MDDGLGDETFIEGGDRWSTVKNDEYGTTGGGWEWKPGDINGLLMDR